MLALLIIKHRNVKVFVKMFMLLYLCSWIMDSQQWYIGKSISLLVDIYRDCEL